MHARRIARLSLTAALYVVLTYGFNLLGPGLNISYGPLQVRIAEGLTMLALFDPLMPLALYAGCLLANLLGGLGLPDIVFGPLLTLAAGYATWLARRIPVLPFLPPILFNALGVAAYLYFLLGIRFDFASPAAGSAGLPAALGWAASHPYWAMAVTIGIGQTISVGLFGILFMRLWRLLDRPGEDSAL